jgi:hypothetical protein
VLVCGWLWFCRCWLEEAFGRSIECGGQKAVLMGGEGVSSTGTRDEGVEGCVIYICIHREREREQKSLDIDLYTFYSIIFQQTPYEIHEVARYT